MAEVVSNDNDVPTFRRRVDWGAFVALMENNPGHWVKQSTNSAASAAAAARRLRGHDPSPLGPAGKFEAHSRGCDVWARTRGDGEDSMLIRPELVTAEEVFGSGIR